MANWQFYGRDRDLEELKSLVSKGRWFFCRIQGRRRIGKTALLKNLAAADDELQSRILYLQVPDSDEHGVVETFNTALQESDLAGVRELASSVNSFATMAVAIEKVCRLGMFVVLDEFQYFSRSTLRPFNSFLQAQVDRLIGTSNGGLFVLGSIQTEMEALLEDKGAPLYGRLTFNRDLDHWDFEDLLEVFHAHRLQSPRQWLTLWTFFEGVPKFYRDACEQGLFEVGEDSFSFELLSRLFLISSSPLAEEADTWFLREIRGRGVSVLKYIANHPGCTHGELAGALGSKSESTVLGSYISNLVKHFRMVDKKLPVFSESNGRNARYYIADNFLQAWLAVVKPARDAAKIRREDMAIRSALPRLMTLEGHAFEKLIRNLHVECSRKGLGDFELSDINMGYWNRARDATRSVELDVVALNQDFKTVRFGSCKRTASAHDSASLAEFDRHIGGFLSSKEGRRLLGWNVQKICFSPIFDEQDRARLKAKGYECRDLVDYAKLPWRSPNSQVSVPE